MNFAIKQAPVVEEHPVKGVRVLVYRADLSVADEFVPFVKCAVMPAFCDWAKEHVDAVGYYAIKESYWVADLFRECTKRGIDTLITHPKIKELAPWAEQMHGDLYFLNPNHYAINFAISRKLLHERHGDRALMLPMGINTPTFVRLQTLFFKQFPLPYARTYVVPAGSGTASSCVALATPTACTICAIATRPRASVERVIQENAPLDFRVRVFEHHHESDNATWPVTKFWERIAYSWLEEQITQLAQPICFVNLGR